VIKLLKDMQDQLLNDKKTEEEMFDKMSCWCKVNGEGKTEAVETATRRIADLDSRIKALTAKGSELTTSIKQLEDEVASNTESLATATKMREEEHAQFNANEKDLLLSIDSLKHALVVLAPKSGKFSFLQSSSETSSLSEIKARLRGITTDELLNQILTPTDRHALSAFMQAGYAPQSGELLVGVRRPEVGQDLGDRRGREADQGEDRAAQPHEGRER